MGAGNWSADTFRAFSSTISHKSKEEIFAGDINSELDPKNIDYRESRDNEDHPNSTPIVVMFDETGSLGHIPDAWVKNYLGDLMNIITTVDNVKDPQILFGGVGDVYSDKAPLQVGQFESDNRASDWLTKIFLEGCGGGTRSESYELAWYWFSRTDKVETDNWEKRGEKGIFFTIGDEKPYENLPKEQIQRFTNIKVESGINFKDVVDSLNERWNTFHLMISEGSNFGKDTEDMWRSYIGERAIRVDDYRDVCDVIKSVCLMLGGSTLDESTDYANNKKRVHKTLKPLSRSNALMVRPKGGGDVTISNKGSVQRL